MNKSFVKKKVKVSIGRKMTERMTDAVNNVTKLRFLTVEEEFRKKKYIIDEAGGNLSTQILKVKLNMEPIYGNFKGNIKIKMCCPHLHCRMEFDTTVRD